MHILSRAGNMVRTPRTEWPVIAAEPGDLLGLFAGYVAILAALPLAAELAASVIGGVPFGAALGLSLSGYLLALVDVAILGIVARGLAPRFGGEGSLAQSLKLAAFGCTPAWLGGVFLLVPGIGSVLALAATFYGIYVYYLGIPELTGVPAERRTGYFLLVMALTIALALVAAAMLAGATGHYGFVNVQG
jgi:Yip1 domain